MNMMTAFIIGNGESRKDFDLEKLRPHGVIYGCNALYRDFEPDYLVAIDDKMIKEINESEFPKEKFIVPTREEQYEPIEMHGSRVRPRSNAGMNAIMEAIKRGSTEIYLIGFDFLIHNDKMALSNMYDGTNAYGPETRTSLPDSRNRMNFLGFVMKKYSSIKFVFCYPKGLSVYTPALPNFDYKVLEDFK